MIRAAVNMKGELFADHGFGTGQPVHFKTSVNPVVIGDCEHQAIVSHGLSAIQLRKAHLFHTERQGIPDLGVGELPVGFQAERSS